MRIWSHCEQPFKYKKENYMVRLIRRQFTITTMFTLYNGPVSIVIHYDVHVWSMMFGHRSYVQKRSVIDCLAKKKSIIHYLQVFARQTVQITILCRNNNLHIHGLEHVNI